MESRRIVSQPLISFCGKSATDSHNYAGYQKHGSDTFAKETDGDDSSYERGYSIIGTGFGNTNGALSIGVATDAKAKGQQVYEKRE